MNKFMARTNITRIERVSVLVMFYQELELDVKSYDITIRVLLNHDSRIYRDLLMKGF